MSDLKSFRQNADPLTLENLNLAGKNVLVRVDYNCPAEGGKITNNYRIKESLGALERLKEKGVKRITLATHFGRPEGKYDPTFSVEPLRAELENLWGEKIVSPPFDADFNKYSDSVSHYPLPISHYPLPVFLWENTRFWPGEEANDPVFARALAKNQDVFINEAFSASHREHASIVGVAKLLPAYAGLRLAEESREIYRLINTETNPSVAIVGGAKIETKIPVLRALAKNYDKILLGGKIAIEFEEMERGTGNAERGKEENWTKKVVLPEEYADKEKLDISVPSALRFAQIIEEAKKIIWNGPMGKFENAENRKGSEIVARAVVENKNALRLVGGGDTVELLEELGLQDQAGFVSTGGGAMLDYIADGTLPGLEGLTY